MICSSNGVNLRVDITGYYIRVQFYYSHVWSAIGKGNGSVPGGLMPLSSPAICYQSSFRPNWICRDVVEVALITPAVLDGAEPADVNTTGFGVEKFVWLRILKNSDRNCSFNFSESGNSLSAEKSSVANPGPVNTSRPTFP